MKEALDVELLTTIRAVHAGRKSISPEVSFQLAEHATTDALTGSEIRVLTLIAEGKANKESPAAVARSAAVRWPVDAGRGSTRCGDGRLPHHFSPGRLASIRADRGHGRGADPAGTRRMVIRCPALRLEGNHHSCSAQAAGLF
ncbi:MAG: response regulator transcription factor [Methylobacteriaceae bacterium]|nr:response regulator transcription factor [Methylobacteriaceae bacterium]